MGKHYDFISDIPKTLDGQKTWIINKVKERLFTNKICIDSLYNFKLCNTIGELYELVNVIVDDNMYWNSEF